MQGVGFRPFVYRLANELGVNGWVLNSAHGVFVEIEGDGDSVRQFLLRLEKEKPPRAVIQSLEFVMLDPSGYTSFEIRLSEETGPKTALILPDIATCPDACTTFSIRPIAVTVIPSPTAPIAVRASPSSRPCLTTGPTPR